MIKRMKFHEAYEIGHKYCSGIEAAIDDIQAIVFLAQRDAHSNPESTIMTRDFLTEEERKRCSLEQELGGKRGAGGHVVQDPPVETVDAYVETLFMLASKGGPLLSKIARLMLDLPLTSRVNADGSVDPNL